MQVEAPGVLGVSKLFQIDLALLDVRLVIGVSINIFWFFFFLCIFCFQYCYEVVC